MRKLTLLGAWGVLAMEAMAGIPEVNLKVGETTHGFVVTEIADLPDIQARMVRLEYAKNGADLVWLARDDDNKTFSIAFKTPPEDDTGVAHILEHSVLCGSDRYPVKEPFVDLLKSSMATFLNATTWPHLTAYPVSTRNDKDFQNLVGVYLDAVFHPLSVKNDWAWRQEGWHYEFDAAGRLTRNGVVYSEMKGAMASVDRVALHELDRLLFPDTCYGFNSGGDPAHIPELTFAKYKAFYDRHYRPSNARIFLDGKVDLEATLAQLDACLASFPRTEVTSAIPLQRPVRGEKTVRYANPDEAGTVVLRDGWVWGTWRNASERLALSAVADYLTDSDEAPLKKALVGAGLCEDVAMHVDVDQQLSVVVQVRNTPKEKIAACRQAYRATLERVCREGFDRKRLSAKLDKFEFLEREMDTGTFPRGLVLCDAAMGTWLFGGDPAAPFRLTPLFAELRAKLGTDYFVRLLREAVLENGFHGEVTLLPSATLAEERKRAEEAELAKIKAAFTPAELAAAEEGARQLKARQSAPDRPEHLAKLPTLSLRDIPRAGSYVKRTISTAEGRPVVRPSVATSGLFYLTLAFDTEGLTEEELLDLPFLTSLFGELSTTAHGALDLKAELESKAGHFDVSAEAYRTGAHVLVNLAALEKNASAALALVREVLLGTRFDDAAAIGRLRRQMCDRCERSVQRSGTAFARLYASQGFTAANRQEELLRGFAQLRHLQRPLVADLKALAAKLFTRDHLKVSLTDNMPESFLAEAIASVPALARPAETDRRAEAPAPVAAKGFEIPANIGFSAAACQLPEGTPFSAAQRVAAQIVSLDYLWNEVRVKGGAYGAGLVVDSDGGLVFTSYRDPNPAGAFAAFKASGRALREYLAAGRPIETFQVATIGRMEPYRTPRAEATAAFDLYLNGRTTEYLQRRREEVLQATPAELRAYADVLERLVPSSRRCVVAGRAILAAEALDSVEPVAASRD